MYIFDVFRCLALVVAFFKDKALLILGLVVARSLYPRYCYSKTKHAARAPARSSLNRPPPPDADSCG